MKLFKDIYDEQIENIFKFAMIGVIGNILIVILTYILFFNYADKTVLNTFLILSFGAYSYRGIVAYKYKKSKSKNKSVYLWLYSIGVLVSSVIWGTGVIFLSMQKIPVGYDFILLSIITGLGASGVSTLGWIFELYCIFIIPMYLPNSIYLFTVGDNTHYLAGVMTVLTLPFFLKTALSYGKFFIKVLHKTNEILNKEKQFSLSILKLSIKILEDKDEYTSGHAKRVSEFAVQFGKRLDLSNEELEILERGAYLHDIGKLAIPDHILKKRGPLTDEEYATMKTHPEKGEFILKEANDEIINKCIPIVKYHHERIDGLGYPKKLSGEEIPLLAKIVSIVDTYDAMTTTRSYRRSLPKIFALSEIGKNAGTQFDEKLVPVFLDFMLEKNENISDELLSDEIMELKSEHKNIIENFSMLGKTDIDKPEYFELLHRLKESLVAHIEKENKTFYPVLIEKNKHDEKFKKSLDFFMEDFVFLSELIDKFFQSFSEKSVTESHVDIRDNLASLLIRRINLEESVLFPEYAKISGDIVN